NVEPGAAVVSTEPVVPQMAMPVTPVAPPPPRYAPQQGDVDARYGKGFNPEFARPVVPTQPQPQSVSPAAPKGMPVVANEKQVKVTLLVMAVKLLPPKK